MSTESLKNEIFYIIMRNTTICQTVDHFFSGERNSKSEMFPLYRSYSEWSMPAERNGGYIMIAELETTNSSRKKRPS